jgi:nucleoside-diphosphate-sugar epimerase
MPERLLGKYKGENTLVTGGNGFVGRHLVKELARLEQKVTVLDLHVDEGWKDAPEGVKFKKVDIRDPQEVKKAFTEVQPKLVFHLAANASGTRSVEDQRFNYETNDNGTFNVLEAASDVKAKRVLFVSSASVYGTPRRFPMDEEHPKEPFVPYGYSKRRGELMAGEFHDNQGLDVVIARPFCIYGPGEDPKTTMVEPARYMRWNLREEPIPIVGDPDKKTRDFVNVHDIVQGLIYVADKGESGEAYNIGSGQEISMRQLANTIGEVTGKPAKLKIIDEITEDTYRLVGDISKAESLGYKPKVELKDGLTELFESLGSNPEAPGDATIFNKSQIGKGENQ